VVLLTNTEQQHATEIVERFRGLLEIFNAQMDRGYDIAFSDGIVSVEPDNECSIDDLLREADVLMYEKKLDQMPKSDWSGAPDQQSAQAQTTDQLPAVSLLSE
jgi:GGDEF domain-containing protein